MALLSLDRITLRFGGLTAVRDISLAVEEGTVFSVIGPNGAGKTSLFNVITGVYEPTGGTLRFGGRDVRRPFTARTAAGFVVVAVLSAFGFFASVHIESLWERAITALYVYQEPFPWRAAAKAAAGAGIELMAAGGWSYLVLGALLGLTGSIVVWLRGRRSPEVVQRCGIARTFQNIRLFHSMTARENVLLGMDRKLTSNALDALLRLPRHTRERESSRKKAEELLAFVGLETFGDAPSTSLPYGLQRRLEIARALASEPKLLLLDEPAAGMNPSEADELVEIIRKIRDRGVTILLIEHHMRVVMEISDRIAVLDYGHKIAEGSPQEIRENPKVIAAYLGKETDEPQDS